MPHPRDRLAAYREKRKAGETPEPFGGNAPDRPRLFVMHKHAARRLHWDLRLEMEGVLRSWAVPKGPSRDPAEKRYAIHVEDHPLEYGDFEGVIPEGNYGAGPSIVWDRGRWEPLEDPIEGMRKGKLLFALHGYKLRGVWTLVRTKVEKEWLLIKKPDGYADAAAGDEYPQDSVLSGMTLEKLREGRSHADVLREELAREGVPRQPLRVVDVELMLAESGAAPFSAPGWIFEIKYDGYRLLAAREGARAVLRYRRGTDASPMFPEIVAPLQALPFTSLILDGEVVVLDERGVPSFQRLQQRALLSRRRDVDRAAALLPATFFVFDLLALEGHDLRALPLLSRKALLRRVLPRAGPLRYCDHIEERGAELFEEAQRLSLEGVVGKRADSPYRGGRSDAWRKIRRERTADLVVVGFTVPSSAARSGFGALHLAHHDGQGFVYAGRVGTGFNEAMLAELGEALRAAAVPAPPCTGAVPRGRDHRWVRPAAVVEVRYLEWTDEGLLRQPVFLRFRTDKAPEACTRSGEPPLGATAPEEPVCEVPFTNLGKVFWPAEGYTKGDLIDFYREVAPALLPYLADRLVVLTRFPDGIDGKSFFQKDAPGFQPGWVRTERMWSDHAEREIDYFVCDDTPSLLYLANMASIPLHVWSSRVRTLQQPDWCILDLDPKGAPFADVVEVALALRKLCEEIELPAYVKTSGSTGLHILVPLGGQCTFEQSRTLGELLAQIVARSLPEIATVARSIPARKGRVYIDYLQNGHGKLLVSPFSVRPLPGAPVSTPLKWSEVHRHLDIRKLTIRTVPRRLAKLSEDPLRGVLTDEPDLVRALARLLERV